MFDTLGVVLVSTPFSAGIRRTEALVPSLDKSELSIFFENSYLEHNGTPRAPHRARLSWILRNVIQCKTALPSCYTHVEASKS